MCFLLLLCFFFLINSAEARLGETRDQCIQRYGGPDGEDPIPDRENWVTLTYRDKQGKYPVILFVMELCDGVCRQIVYFNISQREIGSLLQQNSSKANDWREVSPGVLQRSDGAKATLEEPYVGQLFFKFQSSDYTELVDKAESAAKKRLQGGDKKVPDGLQ